MLTVPDLCHDDLKLLSIVARSEEVPPRERRAASYIIEVAARQSLLAMCYAIPTDMPFVGSWHHEVLCGEVERLLDTPGGATCICTPPRHTKSRIASHLTPGYAVGIDPTEQIIASSYAAQLTETNSRSAQRVIDSDEYHRIFPQTNLHGRNVRSVSGSTLRNVDEWEIINRKGERSGGKYYCAGVGGGITGRGWSLGLIDDPIKGAKDADSALIRDRQWEWYTSEFRTRALGRRARRLMILTRWHEDDLAGRAFMNEGMQDEGGLWRVVVLPAILDDPAQRWQDDPRELGEPLWPGPPFHFDIDYFDTLQNGVDGTSRRTWEALYQQRPRPADGALWKTSYFRSFREVPAPIHSPQIHDGDRQIEVLALPVRYCTMDLALGYKDGDWTVLAYWAYDPDVQRLYLLEVKRERWGGPESLDAMKYALRESRWRPQRVHVESVQYQAALLQFAKRENLAVSELVPDKDKRARLMAVEHWGEQGRVYHMHGAPWRGPLERELLAFRGHPDDVDDQVDAFSYGLGVAHKMATASPKAPKLVAKPRKDFLG